MTAISGVTPYNTFCLVKYDDVYVLGYVVRTKIINYVSLMLFSGHIVEKLKMAFVTRYLYTYEYQRLTINVCWSAYLCITYVLITYLYSAN